MSGPLGDTTAHAAYLTVTAQVLTTFCVAPVFAQGVVLELDVALPVGAGQLHEVVVVRLC